MNILIGLVLFYFGAALGSFLSVVIYRTRHEIAGIFFGRSQCPHCKKNLIAIDLIPVASYLALGGKCRYCKAKISPSYISMELISGLVCMLMYLKFPFLSFEFSSVFPSFSPIVLIEFIKYELVSLSLLAILFYDLLYQEIPDVFSYIGIGVALIGNLVTGEPIAQEYITGAAFGALFFEIQFLISKGKWVGAGDVILGLFMGIILGWKLLIVALFIAYILGTIFSVGLLVSKKVSLKSKIPFAPFLVTGTILSVLFGSQIIDWYLRLILI